jgi:nitroreductase
LCILSERGVLDKEYLAPGAPLHHKEDSMDFLELVSSRRSIRAYRQDPVEEEKLAAVLEAGLAAPTACDLQPFRVLVVPTGGREAELRKVYGQPWFVAAPLVLAICALPGEAWCRRDRKNYADVDAAIAMDHMILAATALGLGSCWIGAFDPAAAREVLGLEPGWELLAMTPLGYAAESPAPRPRKALAKLVIRR